jgi:hypothetical protein
MGSPKGKAFGTRVDEINRMRRDCDNPYAVRLFGDMDESALHAAIEVVTQIPDDSIRETIREYGGSAALADKMIARKADLAQRLRAGLAVAG